MSARRAPVEPAPKVRRELEAAARKGEVLVYKGVSLIPPSGDKPWRAKVTWAGKVIDLSGGRDAATVWAAFLEVCERLELLRNPPAPGLPNAGRTVGDLLDAYFANGGPAGDWSAHTAADRERDFAKLRTVAGTVLCRDLTKQHIQRYLTEAAGTYGRSQSLRKLTATLLEFGRVNDYLTAEQSLMTKSLPWVPKVKVVKMPIRSEQAMTYGGGNVATHAQVADFADACQRRYTHGAALVHVAANLGLRSGELRLLSADAAQRSTGANVVDTSAWQVHIDLQVNGTTVSGLSLPKCKKQRTVVVPPASAIASGFDLRAWMLQRCADALAEQAAGTNPKALLFPTESGGIWDANNLRNQVWGKAADELGWRMQSYDTALGRTRSLLRFTLHSMRDRFATTAINEWKYTEAQLLSQGGWTSGVTVRRHYAGITDDTLSTVHDLHAQGEGE